MVSDPTCMRACTEFLESHQRQLVDCSGPASEQRGRARSKRVQFDGPSMWTKVGSEPSTVNLEMVSAQGGGNPLRKGVVNHPVCSSKCVTVTRRQLGTRLAIERARSGNSAAKVAGEAWS